MRRRNAARKIISNGGSATRRSRNSFLLQNSPVPNTRQHRLYPRTELDYSESILPRSKPDNIVDAILEGWRRGASGPLPQISALQLLNALVLIEREGPVGRRVLSHSLQIKNGVARGLMERLAEGKVVNVTESGVQLSHRGRQSLHRLLRQLSIRKILAIEESDLVDSSHAMGIRVAGGYRPGMTGIAQRDDAIKAGADGSITVAAIGKKLVIPPDNKNLAELAPKENARLRDQLKPLDKDLIIIGFGKDSSQALSGALAAVLSLHSH